MVVGAEGHGEGRGASIVALATPFTHLLPVVAVRLGGGSKGDLAHPYYAPENGNYAIPLCSWKRAIMLRLCSDYAAYKPSYKMEFTYKFTYILISTGFLCGYVL